MKRRALFRILPYRFALLLAPLVAAWPMRTEAAPVTWSGGGAGPNRSAPLNWGGGLPVAGDELLFGGTVNLVTNNDLAGGTLYQSLTFTAGSGNFTLGGNAIGISGTGVESGRIVNQGVNSTQTLNANVSLDGTGGTLKTAIDAASGNLVFGGTVTAAGLTQVGVETGLGRLALFNGAISLGGGGIAGGDPDGECGDVFGEHAADGGDEVASAWGWRCGDDGRGSWDGRD